VLHNSMWAAWSFVWEG